MSEWPAYVCSHVFRGERPVLLVFNEGGEFQFLCGLGHDAGALPHVVGIRHLLERDPSLAETLTIAEGFEAERASPTAAWVMRGYS